MAYITGFDRNQTSLFPQTIDIAVSADAEVRLIDLIVDQLPIEQLGSFAAPPAEGRPSFHPKDLFKLYMYGYLNRIRTSRLLERECKRNIELIWLLKGLSPCFRTIAGFRSENPELFRNVFTHFVKVMNKQGLYGKKTVALDGTKFRAVNSKKNNFNQRKIDRQLAYIDEKIHEYVQELNTNDLSDEKETELRKNVAKQRSRKRKYKELERQLKQTGEDQISTTDPEARSMIIHGSVIEVAYNVQTLVDDKHKLIVEYEPTNENDRKALVNGGRKAKEVLEVESIDVLADKGYHNGEQIYTCENENITTYVAQQEPGRSSEIPTPDYYGEKFKYNKRYDHYTCPQGAKLLTNGNWYTKQYRDHKIPVKHYKTSACMSCQAKVQCTVNPKGRFIERSKYADAIDNNAKRLNKNFQKYQARQCIIEHVFGTIKRQWGFDHILLKGIKKNDGEFGLMYFIYNFRRLINILGAGRLKKLLKTPFFLILIPIRTLVHQSSKAKMVFYDSLWRISPMEFYSKGSFCTN